MTGPEAAPVVTSAKQVPGFGGIKGFLLGKSEALGPLQLAFHQIQKERGARGFRQALTWAGKPHGMAVMVQSLSASCRFPSQRSPSHGLSEQGDGIGGSTCVCREQNCAKRLLAEPGHIQMTVTGS